MSGIRAFFNRVKSGNIMFKLFLSYLGTAILAVILISSFMTYRIRTENIRDIGHMTELALSNVSASAINVFESANRVAYELYNNYLVKSLINTSENVDRMKVANYIKSMILTNQYIYSVYICDRSSVVFKISEDSAFDDDFDFLKEYAKDNKLLTPMPRTVEGRNGDRIDLYSVIYHSGAPKDENFDSFVIVNINPQYLYNHIYSSFSGAKQDIMLLNNEGIVLLHNDMLFFNQSVSNERFYSKIRGENTNSGYLTLKGEKGSNLIYSFFSDRQKKYLVILSSEYKDFFQQITNMQITIFMATFIVFMIIAFILVILSKKLFKPINNVFQNISSLFRNTSYQDKPITEVSLISQAFSGLISKLNHLENDSINNLKLQKNNFMNTILTSRGKPSETKIMEKLKEFDIPLSEGDLNRVVVLRIDNFKQFIESNTKEAVDFQLSSIASISSESLKPDYESISFEFYPEIVVLIVKIPKEQANSKLAELLKKCQTSILHILNISITVGISDCAQGIDMLRERYIKAYSCTNYRLVYGKRSIIQYESLTTNESKSEKLKRLSDHVLAALKKENEVEYLDSFRAFFNAQKQAVYESMIKHFLMLANSILNIKAELKANELSDLKYDIEEISEKLKGFESYEELEAWFLELYREVSIILSGIKSMGAPDFIHNAIEYINENYSDSNLSANLIADKLSITPQHFSKIFNSCTGLSFPDYVNNIRLEKAKELLLCDKKLSIVNISSMVGYNNSTYFTSSFTKKFGISPGKYKSSVKCEGLQAP